jgi:hypothetical protein
MALPGAGDIRVVSVGMIVIQSEPITERCQVRMSMGACHEARAIQDGGPVENGGSRKPAGEIAGRGQDGIRIKQAHP